MSSPLQTSVSATRLSVRRPVVELVDEALVPILAAKTEAQRLEMAAEMWRYARDTYLALTRQEHPDWPAEAVQREAARRLSARVSHGME